MGLGVPPGREIIRARLDRVLGEVGFFATSLAHRFALSSASGAFPPGEVGAVKSNLAQISALLFPFFLFFPPRNTTFVQLQDGAILPQMTPLVICYEKNS